MSAPKKIFVWCNQCGVHPQGGENHQHVAISEDGDLFGGVNSVSHQMGHTDMGVKGPRMHTTYKKCYGEQPYEVIYLEEPDESEEFLAAYEKFKERDAAREARKATKH